MAFFVRARRERGRIAGLFLLVSVFAVAGVGVERQVTGLDVWHHEGQTFITWREVESPDVGDSIDCPALKKLKDKLDKDGEVRYRIYRSEKAITDVGEARVIGEAGPLSCWNAEYYGIYPKQGTAPRRYVVRDGGEALAKGTGLYVHNPKGPGAMRSYYAVTVSRGGVENKAISGSNAAARAVAERQGAGAPILQRVVRPEEFVYIKKPELHYYVRWEAPPNASVENKPIDYLVAIPPNIEKKPTPVGLHLHCWGGSLDGGYGWWYSCGKVGTTYLISSNQIPYDWWTGYHELYYSSERRAEEWKGGYVRAYTTRRMLSFLDWAAEKYDLDLRRVFTAGSSMGGSGAPMFAIRYPERIAWSVGWVGVHDPGNTPQFTGSYERVYGEKDWAVKFEDGTAAFEYYKDAAYLRRYPEKEVGFITWSNAKNDGAIGWPQAMEFYRAMQDTHRPHVFVWGLSGHGQRAAMPAGGDQRVMPLDIRLDRSLPAFSNCSLDDDPGTGTKLEKAREVIIGKESRKDPYDGDAAGQVNLYLYWRGEDAVDTAKRWEMTVGLTQGAPAEQCTVDITPRRVQKFRIEAGREYAWHNLSEGRKIQSGRVTGDEWGLVTVPKAVVTRKGNRIVISD